MFNLISLGAVCLGAASRILKSKMEKKAVSAAAAAVVGIGLFLAPMEKAQSSNPAPPTVSSVTIAVAEPDGDPGDDYFSNGFKISVRLNLGGSGWCVNIPGRGYCQIARGQLVADFRDLQSSNVVDWATYGLSFNSRTFSAYAGGGYYRVDMRPLNHPGSWIELWIYVNPDSLSVSAWVEDDSAGSSYSVDASIRY